MAQTQKGKTRTTPTFSVGDRGRNRVRVFSRGTRGFYAEFSERPEGGGKRIRLALGTTDHEVAKAKAETLAVELRANTEARARPVAFTLDKLFELTEGLSTEKGTSKRQHDQRCTEMFCRYWGAKRVVSTLSIADWHTFIRDRRRGVIAPATVKKQRTVRNRVIEYDLRFLLSALRLATLTPDSKGGTLLGRNPFQGFPLPKEESPMRPTLTPEELIKLRKAAPLVHPLFELALTIAYATGHRMASIRKLRWSDIQLDQKRIRWRAENDKIGFEHITPILDDLVGLLAARQKTEYVIGDAWVFPSPLDASKHCSREILTTWWRRAVTLANLPPVARRGAHAMRRMFASEMKDTPLKDLAYLGGWKSPQTLLTVYQQPDEETQRAALAKRRSVRVTTC
jgi:integrase